ncbi:unnamed protein product, partial [marine sediment metagenome]
QFYWLGVDELNQKRGSEITAEATGQSISVSAKNIDKVTIYLDDRFIDLDQPVEIQCDGQVLHQGVVSRTIASLAETLDRRGDPFLSFPSSVTVALPKPFPDSLVPADQLPHYSAAKCADPLVIDGMLDEDAWKSASRTPPFVDLISGKATVHETRAAILWDDQYLYVGFWLDEPNVDAKYKNRDDPIYYDNDVEVFIAGKDAYYEVELNAYGTIYEASFIWEDAYESGGFGDDPQLQKERARPKPFNGVGFKNHPR